MNKEVFISRPEICGVCPDRSDCSKFLLRLTGNTGYLAPECADGGGPTEVQVPITNSTRIQCARSFDNRLQSFPVI